jgi:hypothetical protein
MAINLKISNRSPRFVDRKRAYSNKRTERQLCRKRPSERALRANESSLEELLSSSSPH